MSSEVLVIGGGPAGLASAIALRQLGFSVQVADPCLATDGALPIFGQQGTIDKCCGEGLMPAAVQALEQLGLAPALLRQHGFPLEGIRFLHGNACATARFRSSGSPALGVRRIVLHQLLLDRAREVGVRLLACSARVLEAKDNGCRVIVGGSERQARWVVGADGMQSLVRAAAGLGDHTWMSGGRSQRFAIRQHFELAGKCEQSCFVEVHWGRDQQAYVTPVDHKTVDVTGISGAQTNGMAAALGHFPALRAQLQGAAPVSRARGAVTLHRTLRRVVCRSVALVGDASGSVDAVTGDGLALAFAQSLAVAEALRRGDLARYETAHRRLGQKARLMSRALLTMGSAPLLTRGSMSLLEHVPYLFPALLGFHTRPGSATYHSPNLGRGATHPAS